MDGKIGPDQQRFDPCRKTPRCFWEFCQRCFFLVVSSWWVVVLLKQFLQNVRYVILWLHLHLADSTLVWESSWWFSVALKPWERETSGLRQFLKIQLNLPPWREAVPKGKSFSNHHIFLGGYVNLQGFFVPSLKKIPTNVGRSTSTRDSPFCIAWPLALRPEKMRQLQMSWRQSGSVDRGLNQGRRRWVRNFPWQEYRGP